MMGSGDTRPRLESGVTTRGPSTNPTWAPLAGLDPSGGGDGANHGDRVARAALALARALGLRERDAVLIGDAARFHDVGKLAVSRTILRKPGRLTAPEFETVKTHTLHGWTLLACRGGPRFRLAAQIALCHHESWDGTGYPFGLAGEDIPLPARIVAVADVFDALVHARCYKDAWAASRALTLIASEAGRKFDPCVVRAFLSLRLPLLRATPAAPVWPARDPPDRGSSSSRPRPDRRALQPFPSGLTSPARVAADTHMSPWRTPILSHK